ncbi:MAG: heavy metal translocating P-type ATPase metal-binding domain-containing protein [Saprospirales bacterium]|nr:heavy metal translocating P-type ATPase metal-binding domain-containing protein [Saprospirales bacterium]
MRKETAALPARPAPGAVLQCYHCHENCPDERLRIEDKYFCCEGCQMVYEILNAHDLCQFYTLDDKPGLSQKIRRDARSYAWLDDAEVRRELIQFTDGVMTRVTFYLPAMHCASCIWLLEHLFKLDQGVVHSKVNFLKKEVTIYFEEGKTSLRQLAALLASIGYAPEINLGDVSGDGKSRAVDRSLYYKIGVAGFAFGNIMLLSFPEYLGLEKEREAWFFGIFGYLNLLLALPVLAYSARDYFTSAWNGLRNGHLNIDVPLALGMVMLFGRSAWEILSGSGSGYMDSFAGLLFFLLTGRWFQQKTYHQLSFERDYKSYFPVAASKKQADGTEHPTPISQIEPGDIILVRNGELIPADGVLLRGKGHLDYSFVSGEADAVDVSSGQMVYAGGKQIGDSLEISLTRRVNTSYLTQLWNDEAFKAKVKGHASILADRAGRYFTAVILGVAGAAFLYWAPQNIHTAVNAFTAVLIIACPCAVALSIPFTMGNILRILGRNRFYVKNTNVLEAFSTVGAVVFDKTGTITNITQQAARFVPPGGGMYAGMGNLSGTEQMIIRSLAHQSSHPLSRQIAAALDTAPLDTVEGFEEIPGRGTQGTVLGKLVRLGSSVFICGENRPEKGVFVEINGVIRGCFETKARYREGLAGILHYFKLQYARTWLLSGDNDRESAALRPLFPEETAMRFNQSPQEKLDFVRQLQQSGQKILMLGDGLNDAGALRQSDIGIVVAENTNNFTPACDAILHADAFERLPHFLELGRWGMHTVNRAYLLAACYNAVGLSFAVAGNLSPVVAAILMPLSSVTIVVFGFGMTQWKAWRMGLA